ncbi:uncharacterized protein LOC144551409 isoform X2 [Carex rostrata]
MEYERIHKPLSYQGNKFSVSPRKLRSMLLGLEKRNQEEGGEQPTTTDQEIIHSKEIPQSDNRPSRVDCQDMECSTSVSMSNSTSSGSQNLTKVGPTHREDSFDSDSVSFGGFEFQKQGTAHASTGTVPAQRFTMVHSFLSPFSKPAPSKWDDAEKWISSPNLNVKGNGKTNSKVDLVMNKVVVVNRKKVDLSKVKKVGVITGSGFGLGKAKRKELNWVDEPFGLMDFGVEEGAFGAAEPVVDSAVTGNRNSLPATNHLKPISGAPLVPEVRSVSMRDIGTEMTPIASQEPSRTATPLRVNTPTGNSTSSRTPSPSGNPATPAGAVLDVESQVKTRREIMKLSEQLGKTNIAAWASREAREDNRTPDQSSKIDSETRAVDWEEAEKSKNLARFQRNEARIQAWENHQKAKIEAEMQKMEVNLEKIRARTQKKLMNKLAAATHEASEKRAAAEAKQQKEATRTAKKADYIRQTGHVPDQLFSSWSSCFGNYVK